ncbi:MAG: alpha-ribazole phosphatase [Massilia sp.]|jgi:alpha-ribazole phosphatase
MRLLLVRHPQPQVGAGLCYGRTDIPACSQDTDRVRAALTAAGLPGAMPVYASPALRCAELARRLGAATLAFDARLTEMDFGIWEMRSWDEIGRSAVDAWTADLLHHRPGGGECVLDVATRVAGFLGELRQAGHAQALVVCHAGTIRLLQALHRGLGLRDAALHAASTPHRIAYGEILVVD